MTKIHFQMDEQKKGASNGSQDDKRQSKDSDKTGWIKINRNIVNHWLWDNEKYLKRWVTILLYVNHAPTKFNVGYELNICQPGSSYRSLAEWSRLFKTDKNHTKKFFELLQNDGMILCEILGKGNQRKHLLSVVNWNKYQQTNTRIETRKLPQTIPENTPEQEGLRMNEKNEYISFDEFWVLYDKPIGNIKSLKTKWDKLKVEDKLKIMEYLPKYKQRQPEPGYRQNVKRFLTERTWEKDLTKMFPGKKQPIPQDLQLQDYQKTL